MRIRYLYFGLFVFVLGCSAGEDEAASETAPETTQETTQETTGQNVFDSQLNAIDTAKTAQQKMQQAADRQRQLLEDAESK